MRCELRQAAHTPRRVADPQEYRQLGFPPLERDWSEGERAQARSILRRLASDRPERLPRFASESSGDVFAKLVHEEFDRRGDLEGAVGSVPVGELEKMPSDEIVRLIQGDTLEGIYAPESTGGLLFDRELVQLASERLASAIRLRSNLESHLAGVEAAGGARGQALDARYRELLGASDRMLVHGAHAIATFAITEQFLPAARSDAASRLAEQVPRLLPLLSTEAQAQLRAILREAAESPGADPRLEALSAQQ